MTAGADEVAGRRHAHGHHRRGRWLLRAARHQQHRGQGADRKQDGRPHGHPGRERIRGGIGKMRRREFVQGAEQRSGVVLP